MTWQELGKRAGILPRYIGGLAFTEPFLIEGKRENRSELCSNVFAKERNLLTRATVLGGSVELNFHIFVLEAKAPLLACLAN